MSGPGTIVRQTRRRLILRIAWLLMLGCVVALSLAPSDSAAKRAMDALDVGDKSLHFLAYFTLMLLPALHEERLATALYAVGIVLLGFALEIGQFMFAGRSLDAGDLLANVAGVLAGLAAATAGLRFKQIQVKGA